MTSPYSEALAELNDELDEEFSEEFEFRPMRWPNVNARPSADPDRQVRTVTGRFLAKGLPMAALDENARRKGTYQEHAGGSYSDPSVSIKDAEFAADQPSRRGDRLLRKETGELFEISDLKPEGQQRSRHMVKHLGFEDLS